VAFSNKYNYNNLDTHTFEYLTKSPIIHKQGLLSSTQFLKINDATSQQTNDNESVNLDRQDINM
jgi:hypothetical protein